MNDSLNIVPAEPLKMCGNCKHYEVLYKTPTGRPKKGLHGQCNGVLTLIKPIAYDVTISKRTAWPTTQAHHCPVYERAR